MSKVLCIIQARMSSTRLPGKVVKDLLGKPMVVQMIERLSRSKEIDQLVVATSNKPADDQIEQVLRSYSIPVYRGDEDDVLTRFMETLEQFGGDIIVRLTGDCPLIDPDLVDQAIIQYKELQCEYDYLRIDVPQTFTRGFDAEVFGADLLREIDKLGKEPADREHVTYYINQHSDQYRIFCLEGEGVLNRPQYRLSVDTPEDFAVVNKVYQALYPTNPYFTAKDVIKFLDEHPEIAYFNDHIVQKQK